MELSEGAAMHPLVMGAWGALLLVNAFLLYLAARRFRHYQSARTWPRIEVRADSVELQRVIHSRDQLPVSQQHYEAIFTYRYQVQGREYARQTVVPVSDRAQVEALKSEAKIAFHYNPHDPAETLEQPPGPKPLMLTIIGILVVNGMGTGFIHNLAAFLGGQ